MAKYSSTRFSLELAYRSGTAWIGILVSNEAQRQVGLLELGTHAEVLDVAEDLVVQSKVVGGDDINTSILLDLPVSEPEPLGLGEKLILRDLAAPVYFLQSASMLITGKGKPIQPVRGHSQASVAFFRSRLTPMRGKPRMAD